MELVEIIGFKIDKRNNKIKWGKFKCLCGKIIKRVLSDGLKQKSCGCITKKLQSKANTKHGDSKIKLHCIWSAMKQRVLNPNNKRYKDYGGRGITICPEWAESYIVFREWALSNGYKEGLQIDRINNNGNYEPSNCHFVTVKENIRNKTNTITMEIANEIRYLYSTRKYTQKELAVKYGITRNCVAKVINFKTWR